jgi:hypothetical protein
MQLLKLLLSFGEAGRGQKLMVKKYLNRCGFACSE